MNYHHLTLEERKKLYQLLKNCCGIRAITREMGRTPSTISLELKRNACFQEELGGLIVFCLRTNFIATGYIERELGSMATLNCQDMFERICCKHGCRTR